MRRLLFPVQFLIDLANGLWSGYPWCCIRFYAAQRWRRGYRMPEWSYAQQMAFEKEWNEGRFAPYVRCPRCYASNHKVKHVRSGRIPDVVWWRIEPE